jgi:hypothetical protein
MTAIHMEKAIEYAIQRHLVDPGWEQGSLEVTNRSLRSLSIGDIDDSKVSHQKECGLANLSFLEWYEVNVMVRNVKNDAIGHASAPRHCPGSFNATKKRRNNGCL